MQPLNYDYDPYARGSRVMLMPTAGDVQVPTSTGVAMGRVSGIYGSWLRDESLPAEFGWREMFLPDERFGTSIDEHLIDTYVVEGDPFTQRFPDNPVSQNVIYDIDNVSDGASEFSCGGLDWSGLFNESGCPQEVQGQDVFFPVPTPEPGKELRINLPREDGSYDGIRIPVLRPAGQHGIYNSQSFREFDNDTYMVNFTLRYLGSRGTLVEHEMGCDCSATSLTQFRLNGDPQTPALVDRACTTEDIKLCDEECYGWGIETPVERECWTE